MSDATWLPVTRCRSQPLGRFRSGSCCSHAVRGGGRGRQRVAEGADPALPPAKGCLGYRARTDRAAILCLLHVHHCAAAASRVMQCCMKVKSPGYWSHLRTSRRHWLRPEAEAFEGANGTPVIGAEQGEGLRDAFRLLEEVERVVFRSCSGCLACEPRATRQYNYISSKMLLCEHVAA
jgi:hypothetical protein